MLDSNMVHGLDPEDSSTEKVIRFENNNPDIIPIVSIKASDGAYRQELNCIGN